MLSVIYSAKHKPLIERVVSSAVESVDLCAIWRGPLVIPSLFGRASRPCRERCRPHRRNQMEFSIGSARAARQHRYLDTCRSARSRADRVDGLFVRADRYSARHGGRGRVHAEPPPLGAESLIKSRMRAMKVDVLRSPAKTAVPYGEKVWGRINWTIV
jgi:hypothetical protein